MIKDKKIGAIKMEVQRNIVPEKKFLTNIKKFVKNNILLIFDECTSGFVRKLWGIAFKHKFTLILQFW